ncbi:MAG: glycosyltransferase family 39 protein, partial [Gammaproteobacteria bacterium]|nr:glycosyltransferase family 39 protein [Gammaproteobacteria bacterium]
VTPTFATGASLANPELTELFFVVCSIWLFYHAANRPEPRWMLFASGLAAGIAWLTRETAVSLILLYGVFFLFAYRFPRNHYFALASGLLLVAGAEIFVYAIYTGDPLYRLHLDLSHSECTPATGTLMIKQAGLNWFTAPFRLLADEGTVLLYLCAAGGFIFVITRGQYSRAQKAVLIIFVALTLLHFVFAGYVLGFKVLARYYLISTYGGAILAGIGLTEVYRYRTYRPAILLFGLVLVSSSLFITAVRSWDRVYGARALARFVGEQQTVVYTDLATRRASTFFFLDQPGLTKLVRSEPPSQGALYFFNGPRVSRRALTRGERYLPPDQMKEGWQEIWRAEPDPGKGELIIKALGLKSLLPKKTAAWIDARQTPVVVYRVGGAEIVDLNLSREWESDWSRPQRCDPWLTIK